MEGTFIIDSGFRNSDKLQLQICVVLKEATPVAQISISAHQQCLYWLESAAQVVTDALSNESGSTTVCAGQQDGLCGICELLVLLTISPAHLVSGRADNVVEVAFSLYIVHPSESTEHSDPFFNLPL